MEQQTLLEEIKAELSSLKQTLLLSSKEHLSFDECASYTGLSKSNLYKMTHQCKIPFYKPNGKLVYFKRSEVDKWLLSNRRMSINEVESIAANHVVGL